MLSLKISSFYFLIFMGQRANDFFTSGASFTRSPVWYASFHVSCVVGLSRSVFNCTLPGCTRCWFAVSSRARVQAAEMPCSVVLQTVSGLSLIASGKSFERVINGPERIARAVHGQTSHVSGLCHSFSSL